jgi:hypothetical protein
LLAAVEVVVEPGGSQYDKETLKTGITFYLAAAAVAAVDPH